MGVFFLYLIFLSLISLTQHNEKSILGGEGWLAGEVEEQDPNSLRKDTKVLFLVVRQNIWRDLLVVHEEKKISSIVMIQSSHSS